MTLSEIIFNLSGYVIHSVAGRVMGPADYGRYGLVVTMTTMIIILIGNGEQYEDWEVSAVFLGKEVDLKNLLIENLKSHLRDYLEEIFTKETS